MKLTYNRMKTTLITLFLLLTLGATAQTADTLIIRDAWKKTPPRPRGQVDTLLRQKEVEMILRDTLIRTSGQTITTTSTTSAGRQLVPVQPDYMPHSSSIQVGPVEFPYRAARRRNFKSFRGHLGTFRLGFVKFRDSDYSNSDPGDGDFMEIDPARSFQASIKLVGLSQSLGMGRHFGLVSGLTLDYSRLSFERDLTVRKIDGMLQPVYLSDDMGIDNARRSVFKSLYLSVPVLLEYHLFFARSIHISGGVIGGVRVHSKTKVVYKNEEGHKEKLKDKDSYYMEPFKADLALRVGIGSVSVWVTKPLVPMFDKHKAPKLYPFAISFSLF